MRCGRKGLAAHALQLLRTGAGVLDGEIDKLLLFEETFPEVVPLALGNNEFNQGPLPFPFVSLLEFQ